MPQLVEQKKVLLGAFGFAGDECNGVVEKTIRPESGGIYLKFVGCEYLFKGDPKMHVHSAITASKKIFPTMALVLNDRMMQFVFAFLLILRRKFFWKLCRGVLRLVHAPFSIYLLKPEKYCVCVRELRRAIETIKVPDEFQKDVEMIKDIASMNLETDIAYRFPFQDIIPEINKTALRENPAKEIGRVFKIFKERSSSEYHRDRLDKILVLILRFKKARNIFLDFIDELNFKKIGLDEADWFFVLNRPNYKFRGLSHEKRLKIRDEIYKKEGKPETINFNQSAQEKINQLKDVSNNKTEKSGKENLRKLAKQEL